MSGDVASDKIVEGRLVQFGGAQLQRRQCNESRQERVEIERQCVVVPRVDRDFNLKINK